jgi:hypothetical protein
MVLPRKGKWQLKLVRFPSNGSVRFVEVDFGASTGTLQQGGQSCALTAITQVSATRFTASYNTGRFQGSLDGEIRNDGSPDVKFRGNQSGDCTGIPVDLTDPRSAPANSGTTSLLMVEEGIDTALIGAQLSLSSDWVTSLPQMITRIHWRRAGKKVTHLFIFSHGVDAGGLHSIALDNTGHLNPATEFDANPKTMQQISEESKRTGVPMSKIAPSDGTKVPGTLLLQEVSEALGGVWGTSRRQQQRYLVPGMSGNVYRCNAHMCINMGSGWWSVPDTTSWPPPPLLGFETRGPGGMQGWHPAGAGSWIPK